MSIVPYTIAVTGATGGAGVATANATSSEVINGIIRAIHLTYVGSPPAATTDVAIATVTAPALDILTVTNAATDNWFAPMIAAVDQAGSAITNQGAVMPVNDKIKVTISQANNDDGVTAVILVER